MTKLIEESQPNNNNEININRRLRTCEHMPHVSLSMSMLQRDCAIMSS